MSELEEIVESGFGAIVLCFGVLAGTAVYSSGSIAAVPSVVGRFVDAVWLTFVPPLSPAAWPNAVGFVVGVCATVALEDGWPVRVAGFVAAYAAVAASLHYSLV